MSSEREKERVTILLKATTVTVMHVGILLTPNNCHSHMAVKSSVPNLEHYSPVLKHSQAILKSSNQLGNKDDKSETKLQERK